MAVLVAYAGSRLQVVYAILPDGSCPAKEFYDSLERTDQLRLMALFQLMGEEASIHNEEHFKKVEGTNFFEFKKHQIRILCRFQPNRRLLLVYGFRKKRDRILSSGLHKAEGIFADWKKREEQP